MWPLWSKRMLIYVSLFIVLLLGRPEPAEASTFTNAQVFYDTYGKEMVFQKENNNEGVIYYATRGKQASGTTIKYAILGWKVSVIDSAGTVIDYVYYRIGGANMSKYDTRTIDGYTYSLYKLSLSNLKSRISSAAQSALSKADCNIVFDACTIVKINGEPEGELTDEGISWGTVYTTYDGIANAQNWSSGTEENLKSYYNKTIDDMFYTVSISCGEGIASVSGAGRYCFGTQVTVDAVEESGYTFQRWSGSKSSTSKTFSFTLYDDVTLKANAKKNDLYVTFFRNLTESDTIRAAITYSYADSGKPLLPVGWTMPGYYKGGWSTDKNATEPMYTMDEKVTQSWIEQYAPRVNLYMVWKPNQYTVVFDGNNAQGHIDSVVKTFGELIVMPQEGYTYNGVMLLGWSLEADATEPDYKPGERVEVDVIANEVGVMFEQEATITFYAVWNEIPRIQGEDIYVTLEDARNGVITERWLSQYVSAWDNEDGEIPFGENVYNAFCFIDYSRSDFTGFAKSGAVTQTLYAVDTDGNEAYKKITVYIVDNGIFDSNLFFGRPRFISREYYKDISGKWLAERDGGLWENSIWRQNSEYEEILDSLFEID